MENIKLTIKSTSKSTIKSILVEYEKSNKLNKFWKDPVWKDPIVEIIPAACEELETLKKTVSPAHCMPCDILPDAKSIICFFIPFADYIANSNVNGIMASEEWALAYLKTNDLIKAINNNVETLMQKNGYKAGKIPATHNFDTEKLVSNWSHRHLAYIAGIGTFGINNMIITKDGCCGRLGSIIINYKFDEYKKFKRAGEKCLNKIDGSCGICQKKCVASAYENNYYDRHKCYSQCLKNAEYHKESGYADICGKCLVGLPCSIKEP